VADYQRYLARLGELLAEVRTLDPKGVWSMQLVAYHRVRGDEGARAQAAAK